MMKPLLLPLGLLALAGLPNHVKATSSVCNDEPYRSLLVLAKYPPAEAYCKAHYPVAQKTTTIVRTSTATITATILETLTLLATDSIFTTSILTATLTTTDATVTVTGVGATVTDNETTTIAVARRNNGPAGKSTSTPTHASPPNPTSFLFAAAQARGERFISTLCSCIEPAPPCVTVTSTRVVTTTAHNPETVVATVTSTVSVTIPTVITDQVTLDVTLTTSVAGSPTTETVVATVSTHPCNNLASQPQYQLAFQECEGVSYNPVGGSSTLQQCCLDCFNSPDGCLGFFLASTSCAFYTIYDGNFGTQSPVCPDGMESVTTCNANAIGNPILFYNSIYLGPCGAP